MSSALVRQLQGLGPTIEEICAVAGTPGLSLGVAYKGEIIHTANFGFQDIETSIPPDSDTLYGIASITKIFTASAIINLVEQGKLEWTTPIASILPSLDMTDPYMTKHLTVMDLLTHRIGLENSNNWWYGAGGVLLLAKDQTISRFNKLRSVTPFRTTFEYTNWGYALAGEVIEKLSGQTYGDYIHAQFVEPLGLARTTTKHQYTNQENFAKPYAALDDGSLYKLPPPPVQDGTIMVSAQGIQSSVNDLLKFAIGLMGARHGGDSPFKNAAKQFQPHIPRGAPFLDKSYGLGLMRTQLPNTIGGGCNAQFGKLPTIVPGSNARLVTLHGGSQAGYTSFLTMLPEIDTTLVVLTNSIGLADPSGWVNELIIETLVESPNKVDFVKLAKDAAQKHVESYGIMEGKLEQEREANTTHKALEAYTGSYINEAGDFIVDVRKKNEDVLEVLFQGLESQAWDMRHYHHDTFLWLTSRDEQAKRARFTYSGPKIYKIIFNASEGDTIDGLCWAHDPKVPVTEQWFGKVGSKHVGTAEGSQAILKSM